MTLQEQFESGFSHHQAGRLEEAENIYRQILIQQPNHVQALYFLGALAGHAGRLGEAVDLIRRAITLDPNFAEAFNGLGNALARLGRSDEAIAAYRQAINLKPELADAYNNLANALLAVGQPGESIPFYRHAIRLRPDLAKAHNNLGNALKDVGQLAEAVSAYRQAIELMPDLVEAHNNLGNVLSNTGCVDEAVAAYRRAIELTPNYAEAHSGLGDAFRGSGKFDEAIASYQQAIRLKPDYAAAYNNLGNALQDAGQFDPAITSYRRAIALDDDSVLAHWNYARLLLKLGAFEEGWKEFEWRLRTPQWISLGRDFSTSRWTGQDARGKTILLISDAHLGDALHLIRYGPMVAARGATVLLECQAELSPLLRRINGISAVIARGDPLPPFDWQTPLLSLPLVFGTTMATIPDNVPYLSAPPERVEKWAKRLKGDSLFKVGLVWAGSARHDARSFPLATFAPLTGIPGVSFFSLQKGPEANQPIPRGLQLMPLGNELGDFADSAALVSNLDLVISVDTSVAHLAGGLGRPVWTLISSNAGFQWLRDRLDSPWYPTMRLFRQPHSGDWGSVITQVANELSLLVRNRG